MNTLIPEDDYTQYINNQTRKHSWLDRQLFITQQSRDKKRRPFWIIWRFRNRQWTIGAFFFKPCCKLAHCLYGSISPLSTIFPGISLRQNNKFCLIGFMRILFNRKAIVIASIANHTWHIYTTSFPSMESMIMGEILFTL